MKNVGDFLIRERALALLRHVRPDQAIILHERWRPLAPERMERADAAVLCGGPGLARNFYPGVYRFADLRAADTPVLPLALGWSGQPADHPEQFAFDPESHEALLQIHRRIGWSSVRDDVSLKVMERAKVGAVRRTGCAAWYHLPSLGKDPVLPVSVRRLVVTPPAHSAKHFRETIHLMRALARRYPDAERFCVFHRGLRPGGGTQWREAAVVNPMAAVARGFGYKIVDAAYRLAAVDFYEMADLHVGYRVHAHLYFLSLRRPSLLVSEDGRGIGQTVTLGDGYAFRAGAPGVVGHVMSALDAEERAGHPLLYRAVAEIEATWPVMRSTIEQLPK